VPPHPCGFSASIPARKTAQESGFWSMNRKIHFEKLEKKQISYSVEEEIVAK
jgi:hypothetical protein